MFLASSGLPGGPLGGLLGRLGPASSQLRPSWWVPGTSEAVGSRLGGLYGPTWGPLGMLQGRLGGHLGRLGGHLGRVGGLLGPLGAL